MNVALESLTSSNIIHGAVPHADTPTISSQSAQVDEERVSVTGERADHHSPSKKFQTFDRGGKLVMPSSQRSLSWWQARNRLHSCEAKEGRNIGELLWVDSCGEPRPARNLANSLDRREEGGLQQSHPRSDSQISALCGPVCILFLRP